MSTKRQSDITTKHCIRCYQEIDLRASVCDKCGRHQGIIGWFSRVGVVVSVVVAILGVLFTAYNAFRTELDRRSVEEALELAQQTKRDIQFTAIYSGANHIWELGWNGVGCKESDDLNTCKTYVKSVYDAMAMLLLTIDKFPGKIPDEAIEFICPIQNAMRPNWMTNARRFPELHKDIDTFLKVGGRVCSGNYTGEQD